VEAANGVRVAVPLASLGHHGCHVTPNHPRLVRDGEQVTVFW
jgi:hypothetical protein